MKRKLWVLFLGFVLFFVPLGPVARAGQANGPEQSKPAKETGQTGPTEQTAKIKSEIGKRVANNKTKVKLKLRRGAELKGRLNQAGDDNFTFTDEKTKQEMTLAYADVEQVKGRGGLSLGAKIGIIAGIVVTVAVVAVVVSFHNFDPFKNGIVVR
jgi:hypothetical protein